MWIGTCSAAFRSFSSILYGTVDLNGGPWHGYVRQTVLAQKYHFVSYADVRAQPPPQPLPLARTRGTRECYLP